jgi:hypothetical protein
MVNLFGKMVEYMMVPGKMENSMVEVNLSQKITRNVLVNGKMERKLDGYHEYLYIYSLIFYFVILLNIYSYQFY